MRESLYAGQSVNIKDFGVFSLSCEGEGSATRKECTAEKIKRVNINFRPSTSVKVNLVRENRIHRPASLSGSAERSRKRIG